MDMGYVFNEQQNAAIKHIEGPFMCLAGPGAGKTTVITHRVRHLIEDAGINPAQILVVTFSRAASLEMRERFEMIMEGKRVPVRFGTFHSLFFEVLKGAYGYQAKDIITPRLKYRFLEEAILETEYDDIEDKKEFIEEMEKEISRIKGEGTDIEHYYSAGCPEEIFRQIYRGYQSRVQKNRCLDFDDMVMYAYELFRARPDILERWRKRFRYILIDEFQDINRLQYETIKLLAAPDNNLFIVGDDDQSIYGFRGARPDIMLSFPREFPNLRQTAIGSNYRCTSQILRAASKLIGCNKKRYPKKLSALKGRGDMVHAVCYSNAPSQAEAVIQKLQEYRGQGVKTEEIAILFRTARQMNLFSRKMMEYNIPFVMKDVVQNLFDHWVAKDMAAYLKLAGGDRSRKHFLKIANRPKRYLSRGAFREETVSFGSLYEYYRDKPYMCQRIHDLQNDLFALKSMTPYSALDYIDHVMGYREFLQEYGAERGVSAKDWEDILEELKEDAAGFATAQDWFFHMDEYTRELETKKTEPGRGGSGDEPKGAALMTMHGAKGLEFDVVFIPDLNEGIVPYQRAVDGGGIEEERRLLYVAMTRARNQLHLSWIKERFHKPAEPSRFLNEIL